MLWDALLGSVAAVILLILVSVLLTSLVRSYHTIFEKYLNIQRQELIPTYARFAAVSTIALLVVLALLVRS